MHKHGFSWPVPAKVTAIALALVGLLGGLPAASRAARRPNIVLIMADDLLEKKNLANEPLAADASRARAVLQQAIDRYKDARPAWLRSPDGL